jgi:hypothetical protein
MAIIPGIIPPSRENWELINYAWQFFPFVCDVIYFCVQNPETDMSWIVCCSAMGYNMVPYGENVDRIPLEPTG